jgi:hypothetical protein
LCQDPDFDHPTSDFSCEKIMLLVKIDEKKIVTRLTWLIIQRRKHDFLVIKDMKHKEKYEFDKMVGAQ